MEVVDINKKKVGEVELAPAIFDAEVKPHLLHDMVVSQMANRRRGTHKTKVRSEVRGGGKKPWAQKGLGRARAGSIRSPIFRGGGVIFGPRPRDYGTSIPRKARRAALISALTLKAKEGAFIIIDKLELSEPKTKNATAIIDSLGLAGKALIVLEKKDKNVELSFRNLQGVKLTRPESLNVYDLLNANHVVCSQPALAAIQERLGT